MKKLYLALLFSIFAPISSSWGMDPAALGELGLIGDSVVPRAGAPGFVGTINEPEILKRRAVPTLQELCANHVAWRAYDLERKGGSPEEIIKKLGIHQDIEPYINKSLFFGPASWFGFQRLQITECRERQDLTYTYNRPFVKFNDPEDYVVATQGSEPPENFRCFDISDGRLVMVLSDGIIKLWDRLGDLGQLIIDKKLMISSGHHARTKTVCVVLRTVAYWSKAVKLSMFMNLYLRLIYAKHCF